MTGPTALSRTRRTTELAALADGQRVDVIVIGGGITGAGIALDAATRGLSVVLVEKHDLAFGTSRWSSKLVHGGLRYLATGNVGIARRSAIERGILMTRNAPHLVKAMPQLVPLLPSMGLGSRALVRTGFVAGDGLRLLAGTSSSTLPRSRRVDARRAAELAPTVRTEGLDGAYLAYDGQLIDDARLVAAVARTAAQHGARILTRVSAGAADGTSVRLTDELTGESFDATARVVINAAGVWAGDLDPAITLRPSRGTHLVFDAAAFGNPTAALTIPIPGELNRFVFAMPEQLGRVYLGLTDEDAPGPIPDVPQPTPGEIAFLLDTVNTALATALTTEDVRGAYAGLRPLIDTGEGNTADVSREHAVVESATGVISIIGGKLTEYRYMAQDVLDRALALRGLTAAGCRTGNLPLVGAPANPVSTLRSPMELPSSLVARYGAEAPNVIARARCARPTDPVADGLDVIRAEFEYAVTHEGALCADDILDRRTRIGLVSADRDRAVEAADEMIAEFGQIE
ncbi:MULTISPECIES: glycerol-3-phosphate dehydrogenase/oxidase [unclassified Mycolicibacterium]|uniref:glycerol-3-phosphate dehydrogenase/oxidase n=1 Tax=unclassified Mycolicibacterium TaxID=2636767 RepID=UPI0012DCCE29|nr:MULTISPECIES: glycerol-3-phosphate dehydrogenase/oxidase [unclassified Mycolicibacterium]MUL83767.1 glycerol-3-phosphate dehydrogenase/oxidase [Mycolicibacterium sp. CBMA 329]MUL90758.1 glycerol-3-phosphate dehydrogenase/oxidase [Mycolicibacterium sp. CBMA 331]MUM00726.1 glycerol-3-phosphate dehydrogenase/oxidase [Mycolicibacterium sp. CBMA 334]MUM27511.1 glycerol-3-phosphate dehydrogenase/oxidase [Mycolicibacterium sp. CBMA 295]MUM41702.1 glycerol-3-phosphate dehydrogenase/oxidase [Mycolic